MATEFRKLSEYLEAVVHDNRHDFGFTADATTTIVNNLSKYLSPLQVRTETALDDEFLIGKGLTKKKHTDGGTGMWRVESPSAGSAADQYLSATPLKDKVTGGTTATQTTTLREFIIKIGITEQNPLNLIIDTIGTPFSRALNDLTTNNMGGYIKVVNSPQLHFDPAGKVTHETPAGRALGFKRTPSGPQQIEVINPNMSAYFPPFNKLPVVKFSSPCDQRTVQSCPFAAPTSPGTCNIPTSPPQPQIDSKDYCVDMTSLKTNGEWNALFLSNSEITVKLETEFGSDAIATIRRPDGRVLVVDKSFAELSLQKVGLPAYPLKGGQQATTLQQWIALRADEIIQAFNGAAAGGVYPTKTDNMTASHLLCKRLGDAGQALQACTGSLNGLNALVTGDRSLVAAAMLYKTPIIIFNNLVKQENNKTKITNQLVDPSYGRENAYSIIYRRDLESFAALVKNFEVDYRNAYSRLIPNALPAVAGDDSELQRRSGRISASVEGALANYSGVISLYVDFIVRLRGKTPTPPTAIRRIIKRRHYPHNDQFDTANVYWQRMQILLYLAQPLFQEISAYTAYRKKLEQFGDDYSIETPETVGKRVIALQQKAAAAAAAGVLKPDQAALTDLKYLNTLLGDIRSLNDSCASFEKTLNPALQLFTQPLVYADWCLAESPIKNFVPELKVHTWKPDVMKNEYPSNSAWNGTPRPGGLRKGGIITNMRDLGAATAIVAGAGTSQRGDLYAPNKTESYFFGPSYLFTTQLTPQQKICVGAPGGQQLLAAVSALDVSEIAQAAKVVWVLVQLSNGGYWSAPPQGGGGGALRVHSKELSPRAIISEPADTCRLGQPPAQRSRRRSRNHLHPRRRSRRGLTSQRGGGKVVLQASMLFPLNIFSLERFAADKGIMPAATAADANGGWDDIKVRMAVFEEFATLADPSACPGLNPTNNFALVAFMVLHYETLTKTNFEQVDQYFNRTALQYLRLENYSPAWQDEEEDLRELFDVADADKDGRISVKSELQQILQDISGTPLMPEEEESITDQYGQHIKFSDMLEIIANMAMDDVPDSMSTGGARAHHRERIKPRSPMKKTTANEESKERKRLTDAAGKQLARERLTKPAPFQSSYLTLHSPLTLLRGSNGGRVSRDNMGLLISSYVSNAILIDHCYTVWAGDYAGVESQQENQEMRTPADLFELLDRKSGGEISALVAAQGGGRELRRRRNRKGYNKNLRNNKAKTKRRRRYRRHARTLRRRRRKN